MFISHPAGPTPPTTSSTSYYQPSQTTCPHCGYCRHCGRSDGPPAPQPPRPAPFAVWPAEWIPMSGGISQLVAEQDQRWQAGRIPPSGPALGDVSTSPQDPPGTTFYSSQE